MTGYMEDRRSSPAAGLGAIRRLHLLSNEESVSKLQEESRTRAGETRQVMKNRGTVM